MFWCLPFRLGAFETVRYCTKLAAKRAKLVKLMQKFVHKVVSEFFATTLPIYTIGP
jgi:hypothetical protein